MGYNQENFRRIREEYSRKYLQVQEAAKPSCWFPVMLIW